MPAPDVIKPAVVGLADHGIDGAHVLIPGQREHPIHQGHGRVPDAQSVGEQNGRLELTKLVHLC